VTLSRKADPHKDEAYPGVVVRYDAIRDARGQRLRLIVTYPQTAAEEKKPALRSPAARFPTIFLVGWLSCDTVEAPPGTRDATQLVLQAIARLPGFATARLDKAGVGDSEGDCAETDFVTELAGYRQALQGVLQYPFVDRDRLFLLGISNGGGVAPRGREDTPDEGYGGGWWVDQDMVRAYAGNRAAAARAERYGGCRGQSTDGLDCRLLLGVSSRPPESGGDSVPASGTEAPVAG